MARRRGKSSSKQDDSWLPVEPSAIQTSRGFNEYVIPGVLLLIIAVGGSGFFWVCSDHQQTIDTLSETLASTQARITRLQQQLGPDNAQLANVGEFEERLVALEDAYAKAQRQVELALATSEQIKSIDLQSKVWSLQAEMNNKLAELQQNTISIAAMNAIIKNKSTEFEVVKQSVNTMLNANTELAMHISGFSSMLSVTKVRLDEQISIVDGLTSRLEGQKEEINEIKELFASNKESLSTNAQQLMDIKELLESEQIKRTQNLENRLRSLYKRLKDHQMNTESLHFHLAAQVEALQIQFLKPSRPEGELPVEEQLTTSDKKEKEAAKTELENTEQEEFAEEQEIKEEEQEITMEEQEFTEEDKATEEDEFNREQAAVEVETSVEEPLAEIKTSSEKLDIKIEEDVAEEQKEVDITEEMEMLRNTHMVMNEREETVVDEIQTALEDSESVIVEPGEIVDEKVEAPVDEEIEIYSEMMNTAPSETEKQTPLEDSGTTDTESSAVEKQVDAAPAQEMQTDSEEMDMVSNINEVFSEENAEHAAEEIHSVSDEISTAEIKIQVNGAEQESAVEEIQILADETDIATDENLDNQLGNDIPAETEQEAVD
ncbi:FK506-binding protein 5 [Silurus meridionalis]|uniref:Uncharacterized protein n=1 Tax=Silurus meridionalis TaxID=175797 RepID=A0A8T0BX29_SILME|nr:FK506-binding protein 5 [Silurus meridionalis]KAF7711538.1 hypothetical protein HF521_000549 [Silurus meridionalis]